MSIHRITEGIHQESLKGAAAAGRPEKKDGIHGGIKNDARDGAAVSSLSRIVASYTSKLEDDTAVRPDKIEKFKAFVGSDLDLPDEKIDTILSRMIKT